jgi:hypothetical protein
MWSGALQAGASDADVLAAILGSEEYLGQV